MAGGTPWLGDLILRILGDGPATTREIQERVRHPHGSVVYAALRRLAGLGQVARETEPYHGRKWRLAGRSQ